MSRGGTVAGHLPAFCKSNDLAGKSKGPAQGRCPRDWHPPPLPHRAPRPHPALPMEVRGMGASPEATGGGGPLPRAFERSPEFSVEAEVEEKGARPLGGGVPGGCRRRGTRPDSHPLRPSLLLPAGDLGAQGLPRVAAAHHRPPRVRARLPSPVRRGGRAGQGRARRGGQGRRPGDASRRPALRRVNCSEYFPLFLATLWVAGIFFHEGLGAGQGRALEPRVPRPVR